MPTHPSFRVVSDRSFLGRRRPVRRSALPRLRPALLQAGRPDPADPEMTPRTVAGLLRAVIVAVNARGLCATHAARVAELPVPEVEEIESLCQCAACLRKLVN